MTNDNNGGYKTYLKKNDSKILINSFFRFQWSMAFVTTKFIANINDAFNVSGGYFFFGSMLLIGTIFIIAYAPETKGKTNEQMKQMFLYQRRVSQGT